MDKKITHEGELNLNGLIIPCYVLEDGTRVLSSRSMQNALQLADNLGKSADKVTGSRLTELFNTKWFNSLLVKDLSLADFSPLVCYKGTIIALISRKLLR